MTFIKKIWVRILISLLFGGAVTEILTISTGITSYTMVPALICFVLLTSLVWFDNYKYYFFPNWGTKNKDNKEKNDILND